MTAPLCAKLRHACKWIELILAIVCIGLYVNAPIHGKDNGMTPSGTLMTITFGGFIIILAGVILGYITCEKVPKKIDLLYTLAGLCLFVAAGSIAINYYSHVLDYDHNSGSGHQSNHNSSSGHQTDHNSGSGHQSEHKSMMRYKRIGMACGAIGIINGIVFLIDAMLSYKDVSENYTPHS